MMLCTVVFEPPNCEAMLPQKFSSATTRIEPDPEVVAAVLVEPHAATSAARATTNSDAITRRVAVLRGLDRRERGGLDIRVQATKYMRLSLVMAALRPIIVGSWG